VFLVVVTAGWSYHAHNQNISCYSNKNQNCHARTLTVSKHLTDEQIKPITLAVNAMWSNSDYLFKQTESLVSVKLFSWLCYKHLSAKMRHAFPIQMQVGQW